MGCNFILTCDSNFILDDTIDVSNYLENSVNCNTIVVPQDNLSTWSVDKNVVKLQPEEIDRTIHTIYKLLIELKTNLTVICSSSMWEAIKKERTFIPFTDQVTVISNRKVVLNSGDKLKMPSDYICKNVVYDKHYDLDVLDYYYTPSLCMLLADSQYCSILRHILMKGDRRETRSGLCHSIFGKTMTFDIRHSLPILTTKKMAWKSCVEELLWFLRGDTDSKNLEAKGVNIWKGNTTREFLDKQGLSHLPEGETGANYSFQWRNFGGQWPNKCDGVDQITNVIKSLKEDPYSRRHIVSAWNPKSLDETALPPCHIMFQFYVKKPAHGEEVPRLSCQMYQRSADWFLGAPFNMLSYALLTHIIAKKVDMVPHKLIMVFGDTHMYANHLENCRKQISLLGSAYTSPSMWIDPVVKELDFNEININHFKILNYSSHEKLTALMSA